MAAYGNNGGAITSSSFAGGYSEPSASVRAQPLIALELDKQAKVIEHLHSLVGNLEDRIGAVLRAAPPSVDQNKISGRDVAHPVPLANGLFDQNARLERACERLQMILDRVEL